MDVILPSFIIELIQSLPVQCPTVLFRPDYRIGVERIADGYRLMAPYTLYPEVGGWVLVTGIDTARHCVPYTGVVLNTLLTEPGCYGIDDESMIENIVAILKLKGYIAADETYKYTQPRSRDDDIRNMIVAELDQVVSSIQDSIAT